MRRFVAVVLALFLLADVAHAAELRLVKPATPAARPKTVSGLTNGFLTVYSEDVTGRFYVVTGANHPQPNVPVFYPGLTSYISFFDSSAGAVWVNAAGGAYPPIVGTDASLQPLYNPPASTSTVQINDGYRTTFTITNASTGGVLWTLVQDVRIIGTTLADTRVLHQVRITNQSGGARNYGLRYQWDWQVANNDASYFRPRSPDGSFTNTFTTYNSPTFQRYEEVDDPVAPALRVYGTVSGILSPSSPTQPTQLRYASWGAAASSAWDFANAGGGEDSAVVYFWGNNGNLSLANGASATYAEYITTQVTAVGGNNDRSSVSLSVNPSRLLTSGPVTLSWSPVNATGCAPSGGAPGTVFPTPQNNQVTVQVSAGASARNDTFRVNCNGSTGQVSNFTVLSVGIPAAPPRQSVATGAQGQGGAAPNGVSSDISLSDGARFIAFESTASNLVAGDTNGQPDVFVRNTATGAITRGSVASGGGQLNGVSADPKISRDGRFLLYTQGSGAGAGAGGAKVVINGQICLNNLATSVADCFSKSPTGVPGNGSSNNGALSGDGNKVVYESTSTNIVPSDGNGATSDIFLFDKATNSTQIISTTSTNAAATQGSFQPAISCNGRQYAFESLASLINTAPTQANTRNIYAITQSLGKRLVTVGTGNTAANADSGKARITDDGRFVFFESSANNLVPGDTNGVKDVFVADLAANTIRRMSTSPTGTQGNGESRNPNIPCDGAWLTFESDATNLVTGDNNGRPDVFIVNMGSGTVALASQASTGGGTNGSSTNAELSPDGTAVGFDSDASNVGATGGTNVFAGVNPFATQNYTGAWYDPAQAGHGLFLDQLSDGRLVAWWFTFDPNGAQAWFGGVGQIQGTTAVVAVVRTQGARFLPNFVAADAVNTPIGTLTFNFTGCGSGRVDFALDSEFGTGFMNLSRLTTPVGVSCGGATAATDAKNLPFWVPPSLHGGGDKSVENTVGPIAGITGAWYDPAQPGHGLFMENIGDGRVLVWWFAYGPNGGQAWFGNIATITSGTTATIDFLKTQGGRWIPNFNAANVTNPVLGPATIVFSSCDAGVVNYNFGQGFGSGQMILRPLLRPAGTTCTN